MAPSSKVDCQFLNFEELHGHGLGHGHGSATQHGPIVGHGMGHSGLVRRIANILGAAHAPSRGPDSPMVPLHTLRFLPAMPVCMMYVFTHTMCVLLHLTNGVSALIYGCGGVAAVAPRMFGHQ